eukprot:TRINITY_DN18257_c0_g1_i1.p1 TRINITY_DN18257_c0_g1~~TRINITY_DN18257_c0_g1_i1.p1  ORF type:complete len:277 (+),score=59.05 TRINITY_DN18257_c0_g1_i1:54-833(+)
MFIVCVCADLRGVKHNMEIGFPVQPSIEELTSETERLFQLELFMNDRPGQSSPKFRVARFFIQDEQTRRWVDLTWSSQLRAWCQLYATQQKGRGITSDREYSQVEDTVWPPAPPQREWEHRGGQMPERLSSVPVSTRRATDRDSVRRDSIKYQPDEVSRDQSSIISEPRYSPPPPPAIPKSPSPSFSARGEAVRGDGRLVAALTEEQQLLSKEAKLKSHRDALLIEEAQLQRDVQEFIARTGRLPGGASGSKNTSWELP